MCDRVLVRVRPEHAHLFHKFGPAIVRVARHGEFFELSAAVNDLMGAGFTLHWTHPGYHMAHVRGDDGWEVVGAMQNGPIGGLILVVRS